MNLRKIKSEFTVCKLNELADFKLLSGASGFWFLGKTDEELSLVCETEAVPQVTLEREDGFMAFCIEGILDFSLIGILSKISTVLAEQEIGIFAISTFNTDYILVKKEKYELALKKLEEAGYTIKEAKGEK